MENKPKPLKTYNNRHGTMKNQSGTIKTNPELYRVVMQVPMQKHFGKICCTFYKKVGAGDKPWRADQFYIWNLT